MAKKPTDSKPAEPELRPDGWQRFESAVDAAMKSRQKNTEKGRLGKMEKPSIPAKTTG